MALLLPLVTAASGLGGPFYSPGSDANGQPVRPLRRTLSFLGDSKTATQVRCHRNFRSYRYRVGKRPAAAHAERSEDEDDDKVVRSKVSVKTTAAKRNKPTVSICGSPAPKLTPPPTLSLASTSYSSCRSTVASPPCPLTIYSHTPHFLSLPLSLY